jgi:hypothetical protein
VAETKHERILELCNTEVNHFEIDHEILKGKDEKNPNHWTGHPDINFYDRVFVITN